MDTMTPNPAPAPVAATPAFTHNGLSSDNLPSSVSASQPVSISALDSPVPGAALPAPDAEVSPPAFPRCPGETPRAFAAFLAYFQLGQARSLSAVADALGENPATIKKWSGKFKWSYRLHTYISGLLQSHAQTEAALHLQQAEEWARRTRDYREQEWTAGQRLLAAVLCFLESFGDQEVEKMTLGQVSRALQISTRISRQALRGDHAADDPAPTPHQTELLAALKKAYGRHAPVAAPDPSPGTP